MDVLKRLSNAGLIPVVVIEKVEDAVPTAKALFKGGIDVMEITLRTEAGLDAIRKVSAECPEILVGAGTVLTLEQGKASTAAGAKFIVSPGLDEVLVGWCIESGVATTPGCVTPTEITKALSMGIHVVKFFPADVYGGINAMKALAAPFGNIKFIPTGGVNANNLGEYAVAPFIHAVGGSWVCAKADISAGNFDKITKLSAEAVGILCGFELAHIGINVADEKGSEKAAMSFVDAFGFTYKPGNTSNFAGGGIEVSKSIGLGANGHIAIRTNNIERAMYVLEKKGYKIDTDTAKYKDGKIIAIYLKDEFGGFAVHLLQK